MIEAIIKLLYEVMPRDSQDQKHLAAAAANIFSRDQKAQELFLGTATRICQEAEKQGALR